MSGFDLFLASRFDCEKGVLVCFHFFLACIFLECFPSSLRANVLEICMKYSLLLQNRIVDASPLLQSCGYAGCDGTKQV
jgi:hypothetical protein